MKNYIIIVLVLIFAFPSCKEDWYLKANYYIENKTNAEYLVYLDYAIDNYQFKDKIRCIISSDIPQIIDSHILDGPMRDIGTSGFEIWIYNKKDSMYVKINRDEIDVPNSIYGRTETSKTNQINPLLINDFYIYINDSVIFRMTKNTHLTDSIFGLKK